MVFIRRTSFGTGIGIMGQYIGMIVAMVLTPFLVPTPDITLLTNMLIIYAIISVVGAGLFIALAKENQNSSKMKH